MATIAAGLWGMLALMGTALVSVYPHGTITLVGTVGEPALGQSGHGEMGDLGSGFDLVGPTYTLQVDTTALCTDLILAVDEPLTVTGEFVAGRLVAQTMVRPDGTAVCPAP